MRTLLSVAFVSTLLALAAGCGGESKDNKGPAGQPAPQQGTGTGGETAKPAEKPGGTAATPGSGPSWLGYVTDDFFAGVIVKPRKIIDSPVLKGLPVEMMLDGIKRDSGIDPQIVEELVILARPPAPGAAPDDMPPPGVIAKLAQGTEVKPLAEKMFRKIKEETYQGKNVYKTERGDAAIIDLGGGWILLSDDAEVKKMAAGTGGTSPLAGRLKAADPQAELFAVGLMDPVRQLAKETAEMAKQGGGVPAPLAGAMGATDHLSAATITLSLAGQQPLAAVLEGKNAESATQLENMTQAIVMFGKMSYAGVRDQAADKPDAEAIKPALALVDDLLAGIQIVKEGTKVNLTVKRPKGMDDLAAIFAPAIAEGQKAAERARRMNNLKQIALAMLNHESAHNAFPAAAICDKDGKPLLSWRVAILPFIEGEALYDQFHKDEPWDSGHNKKLLDAMPQVYKSAGVAAPGMTAYLVFTGEGAPFGGKKGLSVAEIKDGMSNTILCVEAAPEKAVPWTKPDDLKFDKANPVAALGNLGEAVFVAVFCDGSVRAIKKTIDAETLGRLIQHADGQPIDDSKF